MKSWLRIAFSLLGSVIALYVAKIYNPFSQMQFIPQGKDYDVCIAVYFTLFGSIINLLYELLCKQVESRRTTVIVTLSTGKTDNNGIPQLSLSEEIAELSVNVHIAGRKKDIKGGEIRFKAIKQASYMVGRKGAGIHLENSGDIVIKLDELGFETGNNSFIEENYVIDLQLNDIEDTGKVRLEPETLKCGSRLKLFKYSRNYAVLSFGRS